MNEEEEKKLFEDFNTKLSFLTTKQKDIVPNALEICKYMVCKNRTLNQYFSLKFDNFDVSCREEHQIIKTYCKLNDMYISSNSQVFFHYEKEKV